MPALGVVPGQLELANRPDIKALPGTDKISENLISPMKRTIICSTTYSGQTVIITSTRSGDGTSAI